MQQETQISRESFFSEYKRTNTLVRRKIVSYLPSLILTSMSTFLLVSVDGLLSGGLPGNAAISAVTLMYPFTVLAGALPALVNTGFQVRLANCEGEADIEGIDRVYKSGFILNVIIAAFVSIVQFPLYAILLETMNVSMEVKTLSWEYAIGTLLSNPIGVFTTFGTYILTVLGEFKAIMALSLIEGISNTVISYILAYPLKMETTGLGYGTLIAVTIRLILTVIYLKRHTNIIRKNEAPWKPEVKPILSIGLPGFVNSLAIALQNYLMTIIITNCFSSDGAATKTVLTFCNTMLMMLVNGVYSATFPLYGIKNGMKDIKGKRITIHNALKIDIIGTGIITILILFFPTVPFVLHGMEQLPAYAIIAIKIYAMYIFIKGINTILKGIMVNNKMQKSASVISLFDNAILPVVIACGLSYVDGGKYIWFGYLGASLIAMAFYVYNCLKISKEESAYIKNNKVLYLSANNGTAAGLSEKVHQFLILNGISDIVANKTAMLLEEMAAYVKPKKKGVIPEIEVSLCLDDEGIHISFIDDGKRLIEMDQDMNELQIGNNYRVVRQVARDVTYQYLLDLNYTLIHI